MVVGSGSRGGLVECTRDNPHEINASNPGGVETMELRASATSLETPARSGEERSIFRS